LEVFPHPHTIFTPTIVEAFSTPAISNSSQTESHARFNITGRNRTPKVIGNKAYEQRHREPDAKDTTISCFAANGEEAFKT
jgi:hypothetical protein